MSKTATSIEIVRYSSSLKKDWDEFVENSSNATFLFYRDFMEYHQERFQDFSLLFYQKNKLLAIFPANRTEDEVISHQGLTYGGIIFKGFEKFKKIQLVFENLLSYLKAEKVTSLQLKLMPVAYKDYPSQEMEFLLFQQKAMLKKRELNFFVPLQENPKLHKSKLKLLNKDFIENFSIKEEGLENFWNQLLIPVLQETYDSSPVHRLAEIKLLQQRFPNNIKQFNLYYENELVAGMTLFIDENRKVVKSQYGVVNESGKPYKALDYLFLSLFEVYKKKDFRYFDLGSTNNGDGTTYNKGLTNYKEELGGFPFNLDTYLLSL